MTKIPCEVIFTTSLPTHVKSNNPLYQIPVVEDVRHQTRRYHWCGYFRLRLRLPLTEKRLIQASGNLGPAVLNQFLNSPFNVTVFSRKESNAVFPASVQVIKTDFSFDSLYRDLAGQDAVICTLGGVEGFRDQARIIDAAIAAGVKRFIPSEFGSDTTSPNVSNIVPVFGPKVEAIDYLKSKESAMFSWTSVVPGMFFDWVSQRHSHNI